MSGVDEKVVSVKFENSLFKEKVAETLSILQKLSTGLQMKGATSGLDRVDTAAKKVNLAPLGDAATSVAQKFSAMSIAAGVAIGSVVSKAVSAGAQIVKGFTLQPIIDGFQEFTTNVSSIQTILANTDRYGTTLPQVTASLDELNAYSDKTIYNFGQMVKNIGFFTNAGVRIEDATSMIKGFSNAAAASGTNAEGAASAAYQLSQALSAGTIRLMDWRSLQNVGMGNKNMQQGIIEIAQAMGTLKKAGVSSEEVSAHFNQTLEKGWLSADVMSTYLKIMAGDIDDAKLKTLGLTDAQIKWFKRQQKISEEAATKVRTFGQLVSTVKESIGSGWGETFRTVIGDFNESTQLFTGLNNMVSGFVSHAANVRNLYLAQWKKLGGRDLLLKGLNTAIIGMATILRPIHDAFRDLFPRKTGKDLLSLTKRFEKFTEKLVLTQPTMLKLQATFRGVFSIFKIGAAVLKGVFGVVGDVIHALAPAGSSLLNFSAATGGTLVELEKKLVEGGGIADFFQNLSEKIVHATKTVRDALGAVGDFIQSIRNKLTGGKGPEENEVAKYEGFASRIHDAFDGVEKFLSGVRSKLQVLIGFIGGALDEVRGYLGDLATKFKDSFSADSAGQVVNLGLLTVILLALRKFVQDFGALVDSGDTIVKSIRRSFNQLGDTLRAMQMKLKAQALKEIAIAVGVLTASVIALSMIDPEKLAKALDAMAIGFTQLAAMMVLLSKADIGGAKLALLAGAMTLIAASMVVLSAAVAIFGSMKWDTLKQGLEGVAAGLAIMTTAAIALSLAGGPIVRAATGMILMSTALLILGKAVQMFGTMKWDVLKQGLEGVALGLAAMVAAMNLMPPTGVLAGTGFVLVAAGLIVMAQAVKLFGSMKWDTMKQGLEGVALALAAVVLAVNLMPPTLPLIAAGLVVMGVALGVISKAVKSFGQMKWDELRNGIGGLAVVLAALTIAALAMNGAIVGAAAIVVMAGALKILADVMVTLAQLSLGQIGGALLAIAGVLVVLGIAAIGAIAVLPGLLAMAVALPLIGAGFALLGAGAYLAARALEIIAKVGIKSFAVIAAMLVGFTDLLPALAAGIALFFVKLAVDLFKGIGPVIDVLVEALGKLLGGLIKLLPKVIKIVGLLVGGIIRVLRDHVPDLIKGAFEIIRALLKGLDDHIGEFTDRAASIIEKFLTGLAENMPDLVGAGVDLIVAFLQGIGDSAETITMAAANLIIQFIAGIVGAEEAIISAGFNVLMHFLQGIADHITDALKKGAEIIVQLIAGLEGAVEEVMSAGFKALTDFLQGIQDHIQEAIDKGADVMVSLISGLEGAVEEVTSAGAKALTDFLDGIDDKSQKIIAKGIAVVLSFLRGTADKTIGFVNAAADILVNFLNGMATAIRTHSGEIHSAGRNLAAAILEGLTYGLSTHVDDVVRAVVNIAKRAIDAAKRVFGVNSPSKVFMEIGGHVVDGLAIGIGRDKPVTDAMRHMANNTVDAYNDTVKKIGRAFGDIHNVNPVITPVLDLSKIEAKAGAINKLISAAPITADVTYQQARYIAHTNDRQDQTPDGSGDTSVTYEYNQTIISPTPIRTKDVYRGSKSMFAKKKEEFKIP